MLSVMRCARVDGLQADVTVTRLDEADFLVVTPAVPCHVCMCSCIHIDETTAHASTHTCVRTRTHTRARKRACKHASTNALWWQGTVVRDMHWLRNSTPADAMCYALDVTAYTFAHARTHARAHIRTHARTHQF